MRRYISINAWRMLLLGALLAACPKLPAAAETDVAEASLSVTVSTSLLGAAVRAIAGPWVGVNLLIPPHTCPGHFAFTPHQAALTAESKLFLTHGFEPFMRSVSTRYDGIHHRIQAPGNAMVPTNHIAVAAEICEVLGTFLPDVHDRLRARRDRYAERIRDVARRQRMELSGWAGMPVVAALHIRQLVEWMGLAVVADFPRDEALTANRFRELVDRGTAERVVLVVDNLQSSGRLGRRLAEALGVPLVVISNFPDQATADGYPAALTAACHAVLKSLPAAVDPSDRDGGGHGAGD